MEATRSGDRPAATIAACACGAWLVRRGRAVLSAECAVRHDKATTTPSPRGVQAGTRIMPLRADTTGSAGTTGKDLSPGMSNAAKLGSACLRLRGGPSDVYISTTIATQKCMTVKVMIRTVVCNWQKSDTLTKNKGREVSSFLGSMKAGCQRLDRKGKTGEGDGRRKDRAELMRLCSNHHVDKVQQMRADEARMK
ncbi:hypothetical protein DFH09DRAFT_1081116 [Mycena vulgaris]|nr:hypothetical protein DFH09DRAFT_1081116 [Mycena vulgaris]